MKELPRYKQARSLSWPSPHSHKPSAWEDLRDHGSIMAAIAAGTISKGGRYNGVAPAAKVISCRSDFYTEQEVCDIYRHLINLVKRGRVTRLVINNSYADRMPLFINAGNPLIRLIQEAVQLGIVVVFCAGNNHNYRQRSRQPEYPFGTIWGINSLDEVLCVGTVDREYRLDSGSLNSYGHRDSGRGPGQLANRYPKPDFVVPTYGEVPTSQGYKLLPWWGTSGAAAAASGLVALMLSCNNYLSVTDVREIIQTTCTKLPHLTSNDIGAGAINCVAAVKLSLNRLRK
jgi:serine protease AprX